MLRRKFIFTIFVLSPFLGSTQVDIKTLSEAALSIINPNIAYDPSYFVMDYPNGDVPKDKGVCTDVVIRSYRKIGIDLQQKVHEDMSSHFDLSPQYWGLKRPDKNIDHRRVPNLMTFFSRHGSVLPKSKKALDYKPGEVVCWNLSGGITHIGVVVDRKSTNGERYLIVHNIGSGQVLEDVLFRYDIIGHYQY